VGQNAAWHVVNVQMLLSRITWWGGVCERLHIAGQGGGAFSEGVLHVNSLPGRQRGHCSGRPLRHPGPGKAQAGSILNSDMPASFQNRDVNSPVSVCTVTMAARQCLMNDAVVGMSGSRYVNGLCFDSLLGAWSCNDKIQLWSKWKTAHMRICGQEIGDGGKHSLTL